MRQFAAVLSFSAHSRAFRLFLLGVGAVLVVAALTTAAGAQPADVNVISDDVIGVNQTTSAHRQQPETTIAVDPHSPAVIVAGAQDFRRATLQRATCGGDRWNGFYRSSDGGGTWTNALVPGFCSATTDAERGVTPQQPGGSPLSQFSTTSDPVVAFDSQGNLYYAHNAFNQNPFSTVPRCVHETSRTSVSTYADDAATYVRTVMVPSGPGQAPIHFDCGPGASRFDDKEWITVDRFSSDLPQRVYVSWTRFGSAGGDSTIWLSHSDDGAASFSPPTQVNRPLPGELTASMQATDPSGNVYVVFAQIKDGGSTTPRSGIWVARSADGGQTFTQTEVAAIDEIPSPLYPGGFRTPLPAPAIAADANGLYAVWAEELNGRAAIAFSRSVDGGQTWSAPEEISISSGQAFFPALAVAGGTIHVAWYDSRLSTTSPTINKLDVYYSHAASSGSVSFSTPSRVTDVSFDPNLVSRFPVVCQPFIGDYIDIDAVGGGPAVVDWADNRNVVDPLTSAECQDFIQRPTDPAIQSRLDSGALDQETYAHVIGP